MMNPHKIEKIFDSLTLIAKDLAPVSQAKVSSCVYYKNKIISYGYCQYKTHPFQVKYQKNEHACFLHAENDAIKKAIFRIGEKNMKKAKLFVCRIKTDIKKRNYYYGIAKPCVGCQECIDMYKIKEVYYTVDTLDFNLKYEMKL